jgi:hypothetical protein
MMTANELGRYLGYNAGFDLPIEERKIISTLAASDEPRDARRLAKIIADSTPALPKGMRDTGPGGGYADAFRSNFLDGATAPGPHRKLVDA